MFELVSVYTDTYEKEELENFDFKKQDLSFAKFQKKLGQLKGGKIYHLDLLKFYGRDSLLTIIPYYHKYLRSKYLQIDISISYKEHDADYYDNTLYESNLYFN